MAVLLAGYFAKLVYWLSTGNTYIESDHHASVIDGSVVIDPDADDITWMFMQDQLEDWSHSVSPFHYTHVLAGTMLVGLMSMLHFIMFIGRLDPFTFNNIRRGAGGDDRGGAGVVIVIILTVIGVVRALYVIYGLVGNWIKNVGLDSMESMVLDIPDDPDDEDFTEHNSDKGEHSPMGTFPPETHEQVHPIADDMNLADPDKMQH